MPSGPADILLQEYAACADRQRSEELLEILLVEHALPAVRKVVRHKLSFQGASELQDVEDVALDVVVELIGRLRATRQGGAADGIGGFSGYAAVAAYHACNEYLRRKYPSRYRLKTRLRYLLNHAKGLAIWEASNGDWFCCLSEWTAEGRPPVAAEAGDERLEGIPRGSAAGPPAELVSAVLQRLGGPVEFDRLVGIMAEIWGIEDAAPLGTAVLETGAAQMDAGEQLDLKRWMKQLWEQIRELPHGQRSALLLNLRAGSSNSPALALLPLTGVATAREVAHTLGIDAEEMAAMWARLPLDDLEIAGRLGVSRQQVINLRKSARERLIRRLGK